jgi:hypothetical protein
MPSISQLITFLTAVSPLLCFYFLFFASRLRLSGAMIPLLILEIASFSTDMYCYWANSHRIRTLNVLNFYFYVEFVSIAFIYFYLLKFKNVFLFGLFIFAYTFYFAGAFYEHMIHPKLYSRVPESTMVVIMSLKSFFDIIENSKHARLQDDFKFWLNTGFLIYFTNSLFIFLFQQYVLSSRNLAFLWIIHNIFNLVCTLCLAAGVKKWITLKKSLSVS